MSASNCSITSALVWPATGEAEKGLPKRSNANTRPRGLRHRPVIVRRPPSEERASVEEGQLAVPSLKLTLGTAFSPSGTSKNSCSRKLKPFAMRFDGTW